MTIQSLVRVETSFEHTIELLQIGKEYRIDSRRVAPNIGIEHKSFLETLRTYQTELEHFGVMPFETAKPPKGSQGGRPETYVMLNRNQVLFAITLSRNTPEVVQWKMALIDALDQLERQALPRKVLASHQILGSNRQRILDLLNEQTEPIRVETILSQSLLPGMKENNLRKTLQRMADQGQICRTSLGFYWKIDGLTLH